MRTEARALGIAILLGAAIPANAEPCAPMHAASCTTSGGSTGYVAVQATSEKGQANGYASLDGDGKVPSAQLPAAQGGYCPPVGSIHVSTVSTNPGDASQLNCGTWSAFGAGRVLVGFDAGQTEFDTGGETGGAKTHTLSVAEMPAHTHVVTSQTATTGSATSYEHGTLDTSSAEAEATEVTGSTGSGQAFSRLMPYVTVYFFRRDS